MNKKSTSFLKNYKRLTVFLKGKYRLLILSLVMILIVQVLNFISPLIVKSLLDDYIMGIEYDWVLVTENDKYTVKIDDKFLKQERHLDNNDEVLGDASVIVYQSGYYLIFDDVESGTRDIKDNKLIITNDDGVFEYDFIRLSSKEIFKFYNPVLPVIIFIIVLLFIKSVLTITCSFIKQISSCRVINRIVLEERIKGLQAVERLPIKNFEEEPAGKMANRIISDVDGTLTMYNQIINLFFNAFLSFVFAYAGMFYLDPKLALWSFAFYPFIFIWVKFFLNRLKKIAVKVNESRSMLTAKINEIINGINILQIFNFKKKTVEEFNVINEEYKTEQLKDAKLSLVGGWNMLNVLRGIITTFIVVYFGINNLTVGGIVVSAGLIYAYNEYILKLVDPINIVFTQISAFQHSHVQSDRYHALIESDLESDEKESIPRYKGDILFDNIWFSYVDNNYVLKGVTIDVKAGQMVGLVGHTGSGKSSLMNLLLRFYDLNDPLSGSIYIDGTDIKTYSKRTYREHIGIVLQEPILFKGTIYDNIAFGKDVSKEKVIEVMKTIGGDKIIEKFPNGIDQEITRAGVNLSSGEKQIISLARVLVHDPAILIMDEATSHIDLETEAIIKKALQVVSVNRTVIVIAHRLSTIFDADNIIVLDHGLKVEEGKHSELVKKNGVYANIYRAQVANIDQRDF